MTDRLEEIRGLLAKATPGEWTFRESFFRHGTDSDGHAVEVYVDACAEDQNGEATITGVVTRDDDLRLAAAAPRLLSWALSRLERAERLVSEACNAECSCGGSGPNDPGACVACRVYHRALAARAGEGMEGT